MAQIDPKNFVTSADCFVMARTCSRNFRRYEYFIDKTLKGTKPGDIPIEEPLKHDLVVNARTAKSLGLSLPTSILVPADEVME